MTGRLPTAMFTTAMLPTAGLVAAGGALGASARWAVVAATDPGGRFPWATLAVNVLGCVIVGLLAGAGHSLAMLAGIGFAGGLTTFSTFSVEIAELLDEGEPAVAAAYVACSLLGGIAGVLGGRRLAPW